MKTTIMGVLAIVVAVAGAAIKLLNNEPVDIAAVATAVAAGFGLIKAADQ